MAKRSYAPGDDPYKYHQADIQITYADGSKRTFKLLFNGDLQVVKTTTVQRIRTLGGPDITMDGSYEEAFMITGLSPKFGPRFPEDVDE